jgi:hypothetical protein
MPRISVGPFVGKGGRPNILSFTQLDLTLLSFTKHHVCGIFIALDVMFKTNGISKWPALYITKKSRRRCHKTVGGKILASKLLSNIY